MKYKFFCNDCITSSLLEAKDCQEGEFAQDVYCPECKSTNMYVLGKVEENKFKVTRIWYVWAYSHHDAVQKSKNWNHDELRTQNLLKEE